MLSIQEKSMFLEYNYVHILIFVRNNWITVDCQIFSFVDGTDYKAL